MILSERFLGPTIVAGLVGEGGLLRVRALLALGIIGVALGMWFTETPVPTELGALIVLVAPLYFMSRAR